VINAGSDTFPLDVAAAWSADRRTLTIAVLNPTQADQTLKLGLSGAKLAGNGTLWRLASEGDNGQNPAISSTVLNSVPESLLLPRFSINIYELAAAQ